MYCVFFFQLYYFLFFVRKEKTMAQQEKHYETLIGPISFSSYYSNKYNKQIYLFGDYHVREANCLGVNIADFIFDTVTSTEEVVDVFAEVGIGEGFREDYISDSIIPLEENNVDNVRLHYADNRNSKYNPIGNLAYILENIFYYKYTDCNTLTNDMERSKKLEQEILTMLGDNKQIIDYLVEGSKVRKQIGNIRDEDVRNLILNIVDETYNYDIVTNSVIVLEIFESISTIYRSSSNVNEFYHRIQPLENEFFTVSKLLQEFQINIMDAYLLARVFRNFEKKDDEYSNSPNRIIIYVGEDHAENYDTFLNLLGFETIFRKFDESQCLNISDVPQPLF